MANKASVTLRGRFSPGTKVGLHSRYGDSFLGGRPEKTASVDKSGEVSFDGLEEGKRFWIVGEDEFETMRAVAMTAKAPADARSRLSGSETRERLAQTRPVAESRQMIAGARTTENTRPVGRGGQTFASPAAGVPTPKKDMVDEPQPRMRQEDAQDVPQRSATITGSAHPVTPGEPQPQPSQADIDANTPQRSATPLGEATPKHEDEQLPSKRQEDEKGPQRSATETGEAEPKPEGKAVDQARVRDSSAAKAMGAGVTAVVAKDDEAPKAMSKSDEKKAGARKTPPKNPASEAK